MRGRTRKRLAQRTVARYAKRRLTNGALAPQTSGCTAISTPAAADHPPAGQAPQCVAAPQPVNGGAVLLGDGGRPPAVCVCVGVCTLLLGGGVGCEVTVRPDGGGWGVGWGVGAGVGCSGLGVGKGVGEGPAPTQSCGLTVAGPEQKPELEHLSEHHCDTTRP